MASKWIRKIHMYLALFIMPWMLIYSISTMMMNHRDLILSFYKSPQPAFETTQTMGVPDDLVLDQNPSGNAEQILNYLDMDGKHNVNGGENDRPLVINRQDPFGQKRITYNPEQKTIKVEEQNFRLQTFMEQIHRRRGFDTPYFFEDVWGFTVDLAILAILFWVLSGLWMWWEIKQARKWGAISAGSGLLLFALFLILI